MDLEARKYEFIQKLFNVEENLFSKLEIMLNKAIDVPERISLEQYNKEIDKAIQDIEDGEFYSQEEAQKIASQW
ncbi:MAG: hypothetical protein JKZ03_03870 [Flavobacteriaceae bacterium]|nr:hypothetical protein [Flavobacteriaceae bacterium]